MGLVFKVERDLPRLVMAVSQLEFCWGQVKKWLVVSSCWQQHGQNLVES